MVGGGGEENTQIALETIFICKQIAKKCFNHIWPWVAQVSQYVNVAVGNGSVNVTLTTLFYSTIFSLFTVKMILILLFFSYILTI